MQYHQILKILYHLRTVYLTRGRFLVADEKNKRIKLLLTKTFDLNYMNCK